MASALIVQVLRKGPCGANQIIYTDIGSADNIVKQGLNLINTALFIATRPKNTCFESLFSSRRYPIFT